MNKFLFLWVLTFFIGGLAPVQVFLNAQLSYRLGHPVYSGLVSFTVGFVGMFLFAFLLRPFLDLPAFEVKRALDIPFLYYLGGICGIGLVMTTIFVSPLIGQGIMFSLLLAGQLLFSVLLDHFGIGGPMIRINVYRIFGILLLFVGTYLVMKKVP